MQNENPSQADQQPASKRESYEQLVRKLADKVYEIWERELRHERERNGSKGK
jgi:hypothetical protein